MKVGRTMMIKLNGKYTDAEIMIDEVEEKCMSQIVEMINHPAFINPVRIMPDTHAGAGSVIGFTMPMGDKIIPNTIGVDIGCGMLSVELDYVTSSWIKSDPNLLEIDRAIRNQIPFGFNVRKSPYNMEKKFPWEEARSRSRHLALESHNNPRFDCEIDPVEYDMNYFLKKCEDIGLNSQRAMNSIGTLGGGNHFIEFGVSKNTGKVWITVHSGSRQFGNNVCKYWQNRNNQKDKEKSLVEFNRRLSEIKKEYTDKEDRRKIPDIIKKLKYELELNNKTRKGLDYISGEEMAGYLNDMIFAQMYARENRRVMIENVLDILDGKETKRIESIHNYIDFTDFVIRKGAISSYEGQEMIIPFNMEDGILICEGKSNKDWNFSAPHGAGRVMSRSKAKVELSADESRERMEKAGIFTSVVPVDECKGAYKDSRIIEKAIGPTAKILDRIVPIMNLKAE